jgi:hypothetical protein
MLMDRKLMLPLAVAACALAGAGAAAAMPVGGSLPAAAQGAADIDGLMQMHACHRNWERTGWRGRLHRHNRFCDRVVANEFRERPRDWHRRDCARVGPVWVCER